MSSSATVSPPCLSSSAVISSSPPALLFFRVYIDLVTSSIEMLPIVTSNNVMGVSYSKSMRLVGSRWFKTTSKCSIHLLDCSSSVTNVRPSLLLLGMLEILLEMVNSQTILHILLVSFLFAACCASAPFDFIQCLLSLLQLFFSSLSFSLYLWVFCLVSCILGPLLFIYQIPSLTGYPPLLVGSPSLPQYLRCAICDAAHKHLPLLLEICGMF